MRRMMHTPIHSNETSGALLYTTPDAVLLNITWTGIIQAYCPHRD